LLQYGILYQRTGEDLGLTRFWLKHGSLAGVTAPLISALLRNEGLVGRGKVKAFQEKKVGLKSRLTLT
jgi:hypothetical protein